MVKGSYLGEAISEIGQASEPKDRALKALALFMFSCMVFGFGIGGAWCVKSAFADSITNKAALGWEKTSGRITEARVVETGSTDARAMYDPAITVRYQADGKWYSCQRLYAGYGTTSDSCKVYTDIADYSPGDKTTVYYNPENSSDSMLKPGSHGINKVFMLVGSVMVAISLLLGIPLFFSKPKSFETPPPVQW